MLFSFVTVCFYRYNEKTKIPPSVTLHGQQAASDYQVCEEVKQSKVIHSYGSLLMFSKINDLLSVYISLLEKKKH